MSKKNRSRKELKDSIREWKLAAQELAMKMHDNQTEYSCRIIEAQRSLLDCERRLGECEHRLEESEKYRMRVVNLVSSLRENFEIDELDQHLQQIIKGSDPSNYSPVVHYFSARVTHIRNALSFAEAKVSDCDFGSVDPLKQTLSA